MEGASFHENDYFRDKDKNRCLICLKSFQPNNLGGGEKFEEASLRCICGYLKIDWRKLLEESNNNSSKSDSYNSTDSDILKVTLCPKCKDLNDKITELFQLKEVLEMQMDDYLQRVKDLMSVQNGKNFQEETTFEDILPSPEASNFHSFISGTQATPEPSALLRNAIAKKCE